ncbi:type II toxin-antitoxin system RelE/ParE family toxin [Mucilaginibacter arboris]|uniref:type II toxin-antitoxin system RelE/ParE family toxin n=1 Tax=Mucilaginibacter arboris TaxID=2682090 RepID=UPI00374299B5
MRTAKNLVNGIIDATINLEQNPYIGQVEDLLSERIQEFRYLVFKNYKIIYWVDNTNKKVFISNIFDTRQNPDKIKITL